MRVVTVQAIVLDWRMLKQKWPALFRMALITGLVNGVCLKQGFGNAAMRVMTVDTGNLAFE